MSATEAIEKLMQEEADRAVEHDLYIRENPDCPTVKHRKCMAAWHHASAHLLHLEFCKKATNTFPCTQE